MSQTLRNYINSLQKDFPLLYNVDSLQFSQSIRNTLDEKTKKNQQEINPFLEKKLFKKVQLSYCAQNRLKKRLVSTKRFFVKKGAQFNMNTRPIFFRNETIPKNGDFPRKSRYVKSRTRVRPTAKASKPLMPESIGIVRIHSLKNNTRVSLIDKFGNVRATVSGGVLQGKKSLPYAAFSAGELLAKKAILHFSSFVVQLKGLGFGREAAIRGLRSKGLQIRRLEDVNRFPHNGCRPPKKRRVR